MVPPRMRVFVVGILLACVVGSACAAAKNPAEKAPKLPHNLLMIPGPVELSKAVMKAAGGPAVGHMDKGFAAQFSEAIKMLRKFVMTETGQPFVVAGSGTLGWDVFAANFLERGDPVVMVNSGFFGDRFAESMEVYGAVVANVRAATPGTAPSLADLKAVLGGASAPFKAVVVTAVDTSTAVAMDIEAISKIVKALAPDALLVVDGVCSVGGEALHFDEWGVDFVLTGSQKALGVPPGLAIMVASQRALSVLVSRKTPVASYYASLAKWLPIMTAYEAIEPKYFATPAVQLVQALHTSLKEILDANPGGIITRFDAHSLTSDIVKDILEGWGLKLVTGDERGSEAHTLTAIEVPGDLEVSDIVPRMLKRGVVVAGGLLPGMKYFRIGHMHLSATQPQREHVATALAAVWGALTEAGWEVSRPTDWESRRPEDDRAELNMKIVDMLKKQGDEEGATALVTFIMSAFFKDSEEGDFTITSADGDAAHNEL